MDNCKNYITMMTGIDSKKPCCAPKIESPDRITWLETVRPSEKVFMTIGIDVDQNRYYSERELCSSSFSEMLLEKKGRRVSSCPSSINSKMKLGQIWNNKSKNFQTKYPVSHVFKKIHRSVYQSRLHKMALINIALIKENLFVNVLIDKKT